MKNGTQKTQEELNGKQPKISVSFTLKSLKNNITRLAEAKMLTEEELRKLKEIQQTAVKRWIGHEFEL